MKKSALAPDRVSKWRRDDYVDSAKRSKAATTLVIFKGSTKLLIYNKSTVIKRFFKYKMGNLNMENPVYALDTMKDV